MKLNLLSCTKFVLVRLARTIAMTDWSKCLGASSASRASPFCFCLSFIGGRAQYLPYMLGVLCFHPIWHHEKHDKRSRSGQTQGVATIARHGIHYVLRDEITVRRGSSIDAFNMEYGFDSSRQVSMKNLMVHSSTWVRNVKYPWYDPSG
ncbi:hypothetical protein GQ53DRAFT_764903 [Thozetella sp. PMI_491]|nr:hypothetical protein GQ53DRAFT_764903 [Thozetella sp. PMI_491]